MSRRISYDLHAIDADDNALLVHEDSYVGVRRNVPSFQGIADLRDSSKPVRCAAINLSGNKGIGRRRGLGPAGSAPLERGGRDGARLGRRHGHRRVGFSATAAARQRRRAPHAPLRRGLGYACRGMHRPQVVPHARVLISSYDNILTRTTANYGPQSNVAVMVVLVRRSQYSW